MSDVIPYIEELCNNKTKLEANGTQLPEIYCLALLSWELPNQLAQDSTVITHGGQSFDKACAQIIRNIRREIEKSQLVRSKSKPNGDRDNKPKSDSRQHNNKNKKHGKVKKNESNHVEVQPAKASARWILDSGANKHMVTDRTTFTAITKQDATI
ncbi:hypothetical protein EV182_008277, partial [Spiromyces aspiralis]